MSFSMAKYKHKQGRPLEWTPERIEEERLALVKWFQNPDNYYFNAFLNERDLHREHLDYLFKYSKSFFDAVTRAREIQEQRLVELAVSKKGDGNFIKFVLQNKAGWKEKTEVSGSASNPFTVMLDHIGQASKDPIEIEPIDIKSIE